MMTPQTPRQASPRCRRPTPSTFVADEVAVDHRELHSRCRGRVDDLLRHTGVPQPWNINEFLDRLEHHHGRDIDLCAIVRTTGDSSGAWQRHDDHDVIAYAENTSGFHQDHIILHEIGHMICQHRGRCVLSGEEAQRIAPDLGPAAFAHLLDRVADESDEHEAETIASLIHRRVRRRPRIAENAPATIARVDYIFGE